MKYSAGLTAQGAAFALWSPRATSVELCLFEGTEERRIALIRDGEMWRSEVAGVTVGARYGYRVDGPFVPASGAFFDPSKLLVPAEAQELDRPYRYDPRLGERGIDTAALVPKAVLADPLEGPPPAVVFAPGGVIYEINVRAFTLLNPEVPDAARGTVAALAHPSVLAHLHMLGVTALELMPVTAWIDERNLSPLGLGNAWGYNPVTFRALNPRLCPGGVAELRATIEALHAAGIGVILDLVFNHTGESDLGGPTLSYRGYAPETYRMAGGHLANDTGCGNTVDCAHPAVIEDVLESLRHFARCGVDGFRFDLAPVLGRDAQGFRADAPLLQALEGDPVLADRVMIMEPWDIGPGGYQLGRFAPPSLEWNDRFRDDVRRFWKGEASVGELATRLAGSFDIFRGETRSVNFVAAHDGFTLWDTTAYAEKHNHANGEDNRDGHNENHSWNHGHEGERADLVERRRADVIAMLALTYLSRGTVMLTMGDASGRAQSGNNNAYCQDNALTWFDWAARDPAIEAAAHALGALRQAVGKLRDAGELSTADVAWHRPDGAPMCDADWAGQMLMMRLGPVLLCINRSDGPVIFQLPDGDWTSILGASPELAPHTLHVFQGQRDD